MEKQYTVYLLRCADGSLYCGQTTDLKRRLEDHKSSSKRASKYVRSRLPFTLAYHETYDSLFEALKRENTIKSFSKSQEEALITANFRYNKSL